MKDKSPSHIPDTNYGKLRLSAKAGVAASLLVLTIAVVVGLQDKTYRWSLEAAVSIFACIVVPAFIGMTVITYVQLTTSGLWRHFIKDSEPQGSDEKD